MSFPGRSAMLPQIQPGMPQNPGGLGMPGGMQGGMPGGMPGGQISPLIHALLMQRLGGGGMGGGGQTGPIASFGPQPMAQQPLGMPSMGGGGGPMPQVPQMPPQVGFGMRGIMPQNGMRGFGFMS